MKKIIYIINSFKKGGPVNMLYTLVKYLDKSEFEVTVIALKEYKEKNKTDFSNLPCDIITLKENNIIKKIKEMKNIVNEIKPDIIHSHGGVADFINSQMRGSHKSYSTIHCDPDEDFTMKYDKRIGYLRATLFLKIIKKLDFPIACSKTVATNINKKRNTNFKYIRNGIDVQNVVNIKDGKDRKEYGISSNDIVFIFCGYLSKRKNVSYILKSFERVKRKDIKLIILGDGVEFDLLKKSIENDKRIKFFGKVNNPYAFLKIADYFISSSLSEGLPLAVMEGMLCGLPAFLSDIDSHRELKECCQKGIELFSLDDIDTLTNKIENINRPKQDIILSAKNTIKDYLNADRMAKEYKELYKI